MTLHGHTRIELTDVHTGAVEVVESDNLITNAVSDIFNGYGGSLNKAMLLWRGDQGYTNAPKDLVTMFYGGLLLYDTPLGSDPATVFAPAGAGVVGTAMAGQVNATKNTVRGSANLTETKIDPWSGVVTYVYEFATSQANGVIGSVCLTHPMGAYYSEMIDAPDAAACNADRLGFGGALGGDQLLTGLLAKTTYPTDEKGVLLYADPEADEAVAGYLNADEGVLELRHHALGLKTLDLFRRDPTGLWDSLGQTPYENGEAVERWCLNHVHKAPLKASFPQVDIDRVFSLESVGEIVKALEAGEGAWASGTAALLRKRSPLMLHVVLEQVRRARGMGLAEELRMERDLVRRCFHLRPGTASETVEGIRALAVDKDHAPRWNPARIEDVTPASVSAFFDSPWPAAAHPLRSLG